MKSSDVLEKGVKLLGFLTAHGLSVVGWLALALSAKVAQPRPYRVQVLVYITDRDLAHPCHGSSSHVSPRLCANATFQELIMPALPLVPFRPGPTRNGA